ncbi:MAG: carbon storage regulator [Proteobacteria bacterium]|nr:carbon storage regulator [Pseudomonadota bacterium]
MLYLTRKIGDAVVINDTIEVTVVEVRGRTVKLGFTFPEHATVLRKEIHEKVVRENIDAARAGDALEGATFDSKKLTGGTAKPDG